jgi:phosphate transport system permease protein
MSTSTYWRRGEPWIWVTGGALGAILLIALTLLLVVVASGLGVFWPSRLTLLTLDDGRRALGEVTRVELDPGGGKRFQLKVGNRDLYALDFRWISLSNVTARSEPADAVALERREYGNFYGFLKSVTGPDGSPREGDAWAALQAVRAEVAEQVRRAAEAGTRVAKINDEAERIRMALLRLRHRGRTDRDPEVLALLQRQEAASREFTRLAQTSARLLAESRRAQAILTDANGREAVVPVANLVRVYRPNAMAWPSKLAFYAGRVWELLSENPRESNTEGGLFPAILGTVMMVFIMSILAFPLGVMAGVYLREYAREGTLVRLVRIAVNNLAGIPSIVFGVFGLGFFVYLVGGTIDQVFFPERLPTPTFGTGGILWASLTLGLLTIPVVIVSTEEALGAVPMGIREASLALGATKFQTLTRVLLPMASPGILTGFILAMARAAGEVAPLMITGVVKLAPALPVDGTPPFVHLNRKFMHLGFHIYDIGFQSPNVEAAKPMVFVTAFLLVLVVLIMTSVAIHLRNAMKRRYTITSL